MVSCVKVALLLALILCLYVFAFFLRKDRMSPPSVEWEVFRPLTKIREKKITEDLGGNSGIWRSDDLEMVISFSEGTKKVNLTLSDGTINHAGWFHIVGRDEIQVTINDDTMAMVVFERDSATLEILEHYTG